MRNTDSGAVGAASSRDQQKSTLQRNCTLGRHSSNFAIVYYDNVPREEGSYRVKERYSIDQRVRAGLVSLIDEYLYLILFSWWRC